MLTGVSQSSGLGYGNLTLSDWKGQTDRTAADSRDDKGKSSASNTQVSPDVQRQIDELAAIDRKVRAHEQAHMAVGADLVRGGASFSYKTGPDGKRYAVGGEVNIDTSEGRTPKETIPKAERIRAAALAPADPSPQDQRIASMAAQMEMQARVEMAIQAQAASPASAGKPTGTSDNGQALAAYRAVDTGKPTLGFTAYA